jgi:hypothetical protein
VYFWQSDFCCVERSATLTPLSIIISYRLTFSIVCLKTSFLPTLALKTKLNSVALVSERTIPTQRPPLVDEVSAHFCGERVPRGQSVGSLRPHSRFLDRSRYCFFPVAPQLYSRCSVDLVPDPLLLRKSGRAWISGQEFWSLDHRGGP